MVIFILIIILIDLKVEGHFIDMSPYSPTFRVNELLRSNNLTISQTAISTILHCTFLEESNRLQLYISKDQQRARMAGKRPSRGPF